MRRRPSSWAPPGPIPPGAADLSLAAGPGETLDCLGGHWRIFQLRRGHRYSTDDLLTAWYAAQAAAGMEPAPRSCLDLGCGIGSVGLLVLWRLSRLRLVGVEAQPESVALARRSLHYNGVEDRAEVRQADFRAAGVFGNGELFDLVTGSPPYLAEAEGRRSTAPQRGPCRFEDRGGVHDYLRVAAERLAEGGRVVWVHASRHREANLEAAGRAGLGRVRARPVVFRSGRESLVTLFCAEPGTPCPPRDAPELVIRESDGQWSAEYARIRQEMGFPS